MRDSNKLIRLSKSCIGEAEKRAVLGVLDREFLGMGKEVQEFEQALSCFFTRPVLCVVNGTAALHLALQAIGIGQGDEVLVPSLTFVATFQAISSTGAKPVACDIDINSLTLDLNDAASRLTPHTRAIIPVHYSGGVGDLNEIYQFASNHGLRIIEDAAHAFGTIYNGKRVGAFGDIACFSFDGIKNITSGEGGCIVTDDDKILQRIRDARLLGIENDTEKRFAGERSWEFDVTTQGWRYHMSNIMAAIGLEQLKRFPILAAKRQELAKLYVNLLAKTSNIFPLKIDYSNVVPHIFVVRIGGLNNRKLLQDRLLSKKIQTGIHYMPNHLLSYFNSQRTKPISNTNEIFHELLTLPLHPDMNENQVEYICEQLINLLEI